MLPRRGYGTNQKAWVCRKALARKAASGETHLLLRFLLEFEAVLGGLFGD